MNIVLLEPLGIGGQKLDTLAAKITAGGHSFTAYGTRNEDPDEMTRRAAAADALIIANQPLRENVIRACQNLKLLSVAFTGLDHVDTAYCAGRGIAVKNAAGYSTSSVAELAFGLMIAVLRNILPCDAAARAGGTKDSLVGNDLCGKTLGIVGLGAIGEKVLEIGKAFGCDILAHTRTPKPGVKCVGLDTLLRESDIVTLHTPLNDSTKNMINAEKLALMKPAAILINTARGPVVDNLALAAALIDGRIAGAGIDVFDGEPPLDPAHPLLNAPHTVLTPHVAFATKEALERRADIAFGNVTEWLDSL